MLTSFNYNYNILINYLQIYKKMLDCLQDYKKTINFAIQITFVEKRIF